MYSCFKLQNNYILQMQKVINVWLRFHIASGWRWQGEGIGVGERNKTRYWGGVGRKDSDKSGAGRSSTERIAQEETNKAHRVRKQHTLRWNQLAAQPLSRCCNLCLGILRKSQNHYAKSVYLFFVSAPWSQNMTTRYASPYGMKSWYVLMV